MKANRIALCYLNISQYVLEPDTIQKYDNREI